MGWTDTCKVEAVAQIDKRKEKLGSVRPAIREFAEESGIPVNTLKRWYYPETDYKCTRTGTPRTSPVKEASTITNLHSMQFDSGRRKILFGLGETDGRRFFVIQEYRVGREGKEIATKNRLIMPVDLFSQFRGAMDQVEMMIQKECLVEPDIDGSDPQEEDEVDPPDSDDRGVPRDNEVDGMGVETMPSPAPVACTNYTPGEIENIQCINCQYFTRGYNVETNGCCQPDHQTRAWNHELWQSPHNLHPCQHFSRREEG